MGNLEVIVKEYRVSFGGDRNVLILIGVIVTQLWEY